MFFRKLGLTIVVLTVFFAAGCVPPLFQVSEEFQETVTAVEGSVLEITNRNGSITVTAWEKDYVDIFAVKKSSFGERELANVEIQISYGEKIVVETNYLKRNPRASVNYQIRVPAGVAVSKVQSSNGSITVTGVAGDMIADTSNGAIEIKDVEGVVSAKTSNGRITISGTPGVREARTSNGAVSIELVRLDGDLQIKTSNGSIKLYLAPDLEATLEVSTSNGKITAHNLNLVASQVSSRSLKGRLGEGGFRVDASTSNGSVDLYLLK